MKMLSGYILARTGHTMLEREQLQLNIENHVGVFSLTYLQTLEFGNTWELFNFTSSIPLPDDNQGQEGEPIYSCNVIVCRSLSRMILLTERKKIADFIIENLLTYALYPNFRKVPIAIDHFINASSFNDSPYTITSMHGRFSGPERSLRTIILYGDDITDSSLFRQQHELFNFYSTGVKRRVNKGAYSGQSYDDAEIARLGNDGMVSVNLRDTVRASEFLKVIKYVFDNGWVNNWAKVE
ncbi:MAG: hypothetical protein Q7T74_03125 [Candidatus Saccharibacteria bacterium]|nr:hypothetical protein [Candidatus Saccharibacteria bacterium]